MNAVRKRLDPNRVTSLLLMMLAVAAMLTGTSASEAAGLEGLRKPMSGFAVDLKKWLDDRGEKAIQTMSSFQALPELPTDPGRNLAWMLKQELLTAKVPVQNNAPLAIKGKLVRR